MHREPAFGLTYSAPGHGPVRPSRVHHAARGTSFAELAGAAGYLTRGAVIAIIGFFLVFAALDSNAHEATGLAGALTIVKRQACGSALLSAAAVGFLAFGIFGIAEALFRRVDGRGSASGRPSWGGA